MQKKHERTLGKVFANPVSGSLKWRDVEALLRAVGAEIEERHGSAVLIRIGDHRLGLHKPHPQPELKKYAVKTICAFLTKAGITP